MNGRNQFRLQNLIIIMAVFCVMKSLAETDLELPPEKPAVFKTKSDLIKYIKKMNEYYAIAGRARFGRRSFQIDEDENDDDGNSYGRKNFNVDEDNALNALLLQRLFKHRNSID